MGGWIHDLGGKFEERKVIETAPEPVIDAAAIMDQFAAETSPLALNAFAHCLGVTVESLTAIGCQRSNTHRAWAFPMVNGTGDVVGIRLRYDDGSKRAIKGSRQGIFLPSIQAERNAFIVEGVTDTAAILSMGLYGFGRPQCSGSISIITTTLARLNIREAVIIADNDEPGLRGAKDLVAELDIPSRIFVPPTKDVREFLNFGGTASMILDSIRSLIWYQPRSNHQKHSPLTTAMT